MQHARRQRRRSSRHGIRPSFAFAFLAALPISVTVAASTATATTGSTAAALDAVGSVAAISTSQAAAPSATPGSAQAPRRQKRQQSQRPAPPQADALEAALARAGGFRAAVEMVRVPVIVVDSSGAFVGNLRPEAFAVRDGNREHRVEHFISDAEPVSVGILLDASDAMTPYLSDVRRAVQRVVDTLRATDELFLVTYDDAVATLLGPTSDNAAMAAALSSYDRPRGEHRALYDAVERGLRILEGSPFDKRSLVVIGAGGDTASELGERHVQQAIHRTGVTIHAISLLPRPRPAAGRAGPATPATRLNRTETLPELVAFTGGILAQRPRIMERYGGTPGWLVKAGGDITTYLKHQYLLHYAPTSPPRPGTWREIRVLVDGGYSEVRARSGYVR